MPKHMRFKCAFQTENTDPKNAVCINPTFRHQTWQPLEDPLPVDSQALADEMVTKLIALVPSAGPISVKIYDVEKPKPNFPMATAVGNAASAPKALGLMPEAAVCLSFYADHNQPRHRGRLYLPAWFFGNSAALLDKTISPTLQTAAAAFVTQFAALGGGNVDWGVWSTRDHAFHKATNYFISNSWATVRSRGLKESNRLAGTTSG